MSEPTKQTGDRILISPDVPELIRSWPDPRDPDEVMWRVWHAPGSITVEDMRWLAQRAGTYAYIFSIPQKRFLASHSAIRAHLSEGAGTHECALDRAAGTGDTNA